MEPDIGKQDDWDTFQRIQEVKSASRINFIRVVSVVLFFSILTALYLASEKTEEQTKYWFSSARVCGIWLLIVGLVVVALKRRNVPPVLKYATSFCDVVLLTTIEQGATVTSFSASTQRPIMFLMFGWRPKKPRVFALVVVAWKKPQSLLSESLLGHV